MQKWIYDTVSLVGLVGLTMAACTKPSENTMDGGSTTTANMAAAPGSGSSNGSGNPGSSTATQGQTGSAYVTQVLVVRKEASDAKELDDPTAKKKKSINWVATVYRGEQVTALDNKGDWVHVRLSDGKEGWAKGDAVLTGAVEVATVFDKTKVFSRPDLLSLNTSRQIEPGSLLFVLRNKDQFSEVNLGGNATAWVLSDVLSKDSKEVDAAKLINRARALKEHNEVEAEGALQLAKTQFGDTKLVQALLMPPADPNTQAAGNPNAAAMDGNAVAPQGGVGDVPAPAGADAAPH